MSIRYYASCLWPGLPELWWRGRLSGLPLAIGFAFGFNSLLVLRHLLPSWLNPSLVSAAWWLGIVFWLVWVVRQIRELPRLIAPRSVVDEPDVFPEANQAYLRGDWKLAEKHLLKVLGIEPRDPPALLLLAGVYRHTDRPKNAEVLLAEMCRLESCDHWQIEMDAEMQRIQRQLTADLSTAENESEASPSDAAELTAA